MLPPAGHAARVPRAPRHLGCSLTVAATPQGTGHGRCPGPGAARRPCHADNIPWPLYSCINPSLCTGHLHPTLPAAPVCGAPLPPAPPLRAASIPLASPTLGAPFPWTSRVWAPTFLCAPGAQSSHTPSAPQDTAVPRQHITGAPTLVTFPFLPIPIPNASGSIHRVCSGSSTHLSSASPLSSPTNHPHPQLMDLTPCPHSPLFPLVPIVTCSLPLSGDFSP